MSLQPMWPLLWFARICGLNPAGQPPTYKLSWIIATLSLLVSTSILSGSALMIQRQLMVIIKETDNDLPSFFGTLLHVNGMAVVVLGHVGLFAGMLRKIQYLPLALQRCNALPGPARSCSSTALYIAEATVMFIVALTLRLLVMIHLGSTVFSSIGDTVVSLVTLSITDQLLFTHLVRHVGTCFGGVNDRFRTLREVVLLRNSKKGSVSDVQPISDELSRLSELHGAACDLMGLLTLTQEIQMLTIIIVEFVVVVLTLYVSSIALYFRMSVEYIIFFGLCVAGGLCSATMAVLRACHSTSAKGNETAELVHDLINCGSLDEKEARQLALFSMQTAHQEVAIVPMGLFKMDMTFLLSFCSTVIMYVVMLLQFKTV